MAASLQLQPAHIGVDSSDSAVLHLGRRILSAGAIYGLTNFGLKGLNFLLLPIVSRYLQPADFGIVALAESIAAPIGMICGLGTATSLRRMYYEFGEDEENRRAYIGTAIRFAFLSATVFILCSCLLGPFVLAHLDRSFPIPFFPLIAVAICSAGLSQIEQTQLSIFQVQNRPGSFAVISLATVGLAILMVPVLVIFFRMGAAGVLVSRLAGVVCGVVATIWLCRSLLTTRWHWDGLHEQLRLGLPVTVFEVVNLALIFADRIILQHYRPLSDVGIYSIAYSFGSLMLLLTVSLSQVWSPLFFEASCAGQIETIRKTSSSLMAGLAAIASIGVVVAGPVIRTFLDARYESAAALVPLILGAYLINSFYYLFELQAFQQKRTSIVAVVTVFACAINIATNVWLVPKWGVFGAAVATIAAYIAQAIAMYVFVRRGIKGLYSPKLILLNLAAFSGLLLAVEISYRFHAVGRFTALAALLVTLAALWPLGLNRAMTIARSAVA